MQVLTNLLIKAGLVVEGTTNLQGVSRALTPDYGDNSTKIATTEFIYNRISSLNLIELQDVSTSNLITGSLLKYEDGVWYPVSGYVRADPIINSVPYFSNTDPGEYYIGSTIMNYQDGSGFTVLGPDDELAFRSAAGGNGIGLQGESYSNYGVFGMSNTGTGVYGQSNSSNGVYAKSTTSYGLYAQSTSGTGAYAKSSSGYGLYSESTTNYGAYIKSGSSIGLYVTSTSGDIQQWLSGSTSKAKITNNGNLLIGTDTETTGYKLKVASDVIFNSIYVGLGGGQVAGNISIGPTKIGEVSNNSTGDYLFAFGNKVLRRNTTGRANIGIGNEALDNNTTGSYNTAVSIQALLGNTTGSNNTGIGLFANLFNTTGSFNVSIGAYSGTNNTGGAGINGDYNILIGVKNYAGITSGNNNVIIGSQITGSTATLSNNIIIADGAGNIRFRDNGTSTILSRLVGTGTRMVVVNDSGELSTQTIGSGGVTGSGTTNYIPKWTSTSALGSSLIYDNGTNIGIGTTSPSRKLDVNGDVNIAQLLVVSNDIYSSGVLTNNIRANTLTYIPFLSNQSPYGEIMRIQNNGNILIGETVDNNSGAKLQIKGSTAFSLTSSTNSVNFQFYTNNGSTQAAIESGNGSLSFRTGGLYTQNLIITSTGNVLIGTTTNITSSIFTVDSTTQGFLKPRMTSTQRGQISNPVAGLEVYDTTANLPYYYNGTAWQSGTGGLTGTGTSGYIPKFTGTSTVGNSIIAEISNTIVVGGTQSTGAKLHVSGGISIGSYQSYDNNYDLHVFGSTKVGSALDVIGHIVSNAYIETGDYSTQTGGQLRIWSGTTVPIDIHINPSILSSSAGAAGNYLPIIINGNTVLIQLFGTP